MRRNPSLATLLIILSIVSLPFWNRIIPPVNGVSASFSFAASGDMGSLTVSTSTNSLSRLATANPNFFLSLGDMSYDPSVTGDVWCGQFKSTFNSIEIMPGDHDTGGHNSTSFGETHNYEKYVNNCPLTLGVPITCGPVAGACYGKEYYFEYPATNPIARFIFTSPKIYNITGVCTSSPNCSSQTGQPCTDQYGCWQYSANDAHYNWTANAIDDARAKGIGWVIVATHKVCISSADATCSMGIQFFNMLVQKKVDLIIQAHDNAYERSKQLALSSSACPKISTDGNGYAVYNSGCVVDGGLGNYTRGVGSVVVVQGAWINDLFGVNASASNPANVAEAPYFAKLMGKNTAGNGLGFTEYAVSANSINVKTSFSGSFSDSFSIANSANPLPVASWSPLAPQIGQTTMFTAAAAGGSPPYSFSWNFGDGAQASGTTVTHSYGAAGYFNVALTAIDSTGHSGSSRNIIAVGSWNPVVSCAPTLSTIEQVIGKVSIQRNSTISSSIGADYSGGGFELAGNLPYGSNPDNWPYSKRALQPPCSVNGIPTFVELHNVTLTVAPSVATYDCRINYSQTNGGGPYPNGQNCDTVFNVGNASATTCSSCYMHRIYAEIDGDWNASRTAPTSPPLGQMIDVQGFVYWDTDSSNSSSHNWSGWELHPFTAWRLAAHAARPSFAVVTTFDGRIYKYFQNGTDVFVGKPVGSALRQVAWKPDGSYALIVGDQGVVYTYDGTALKRFSSTIIGTTNLNTVAWKPDGSYALIGGQNGRIFTFNGTAVTNVTDPTTKNIYSISWNPKGISALIVGDSGTALMYTIPSKITVLTSGTGQPLFAVAWHPTGSYALAAGGSDVVLSYNGTSFKAISTAGLTLSSKNIRFIGFDPSGSIGLLVGDTGLILTYNGTKLATLKSGTNNNLNSLSWLASTAYIVGQNGTLLSYSGGTLKSLASGTTANLASIAWRRQPLSATFTYSPSNPSTQQSVYFTGNASGGASPYSLSWNFGDGTTSTAPNVYHSYSTPGSFTVTLTVIDSTGMTSRATGVVTVQPPPSPVVTVNGPTPNPASTGSTVVLNFAVSSTTSVTGITVNWGDGTSPDNISSTAISDTHVYSSTGAGKSQTFTITVTATYTGGSSSGTTTETVNDRPPTITVSSVTSPVNTSQTVNMALSAVDPDGTVSSISVDYGDGTTVDVLPGTTTSDSHSYSSTDSSTSKTFTITATATDNSGSNGQARVSVTVNDRPPIVGVTSVSPDPAVAGQAVTVSFTTSDPDGTVSSVIVNWGDGTPSDSLPGTSTSDTHTYASGGNFTITVTAIDNSGSNGIGTVSESVASPLAPTVTINSVSPNPATTGQTVTITFTVSSATPVSGVTVNWGDGTIDSLAGTATFDTHAFASTGNAQTQTFSIIITATNAAGSGSAATNAAVDDRPPSVALTNVSPNPANTGTSVTTTFSSTDNDGTVVSISVSWGDGTASDSLGATATSDTHSYSSAGNYTISITAKDNSGSTAAATASVTINALSPTAYALAVTSDGKVYKTYSNGTMVLIGQPVATQLRSISWRPDGSYALISGDSAVLLKYDGTQLTSIPTGVSTGYNFWTVSWKPDGSYALIGGTSGLLLKYNGVSVTAVSDPNTLTIFAIGWNPTGDYALIVGKSGTTLTYNGTSVHSFSSGTAYDLDAVGWNPNGQYALIGGLNGTILRFDGTQIIPINTSGLTGTNAIASIAFNPSGTLALLVGNNGMVLTYNGSTLTLLSQVTFSWLYGVTWSSSGTAYIVGNGGTELTYSNGTLTKLPSSGTPSLGGTTSSLRGIAWKPQ